MKRMKKVLSLVLSAALIAGLLAPMTALAAAEEGPRVNMESEKWSGGTFDLTETGTADWVFLGSGSTLPNASDGSNENPTVADRKADASGAAVDILKISYLKDTSNWNNGSWLGGNVPALSWSDGVNEAKGIKSSCFNMLRGFYAGNYANDNVGWSVKVPAAEAIQELTFITGGTWAGVDVFVYVNGDEVPVKEDRVHAGDSGNSSFWKFTVTVEPNTDLEVRGQIVHTGIGPDMITLCGAALNRIEPDAGVDYVARLQDSVDIANAWLGEENISDSVRSSLEAELAIAEPLLESEDLDNGAAFGAYYFLSLALVAAEATPMGGSYANTYAADRIGAFGWEGDADAPIAWIDGTYQLRNNRSAVATFGVTDLDPDAIRWSRAEGYLPCLVSEYEKNGLSHTVASFADDVTISGKRFEVAYSRMTTENTSDQIKLLPLVSGNLVPLNDAAATAKVVYPGETVVREYAIFADRFGGKYSFPADSLLAEAGSYDEHYENMRSYWQDKVDQLVDIQSVPAAYAALADAYKAGVIDLLIAADGRDLYTGEGSGEAKAADLNAVELLATLVQLGYTEDFAEYAGTALKNVSDADAAGQAAWPFALYLQKTGDAFTAADFFPTVKALVRSSSATGSAEAVRGLTAYRYLARTLYAETGDSRYSYEISWADGMLYGSVAESWSVDNGNTLDSWLESYVPGGAGACPYVPAQCGNARMLADAFITELVDGSLVIGSGLPVAFNAPGEQVSVANYLCNNGQRVGFTMDSSANSITVTLTGDGPEYPVRVELEALKNNIAGVTEGCTFDDAAGAVTIPVGIASVDIALKGALDLVTPVIEAIDAIGSVTAESGPAIQSARAKYDALSETCKALVTNYQVLVQAEARYADVTRPGVVVPIIPTVPTGPATPPDEEIDEPDVPLGEPVVNEDGSITTVTVDEKGSTVTSTEFTDGSTEVETVEKNGTVTRVVTRADKSTVETVTLPGEGCTVTAKNADGAVVAKVEIPAELPAFESFADIAADHWAKRGVDTVTALGLFRGTGGNQFSGEGEMTRAMVVTVLHRLSGEAAAQSESFDDVGDGAWYADAVNWAAANKIVEGKGENTFAPDESVTREMLITILYRYAKVLNMDTAADGGALEEEVSGWAQDAMTWAVENGIVNLRGGSLAAGEAATRAEVAAIMANFIDVMCR